MKHGTGPAPVERPPETSRGLGANLEFTVEQQFGGVSRVRNRRLFQPQPMLNAAKAQEDVPAVRGLPEFAG